jgi:two-component system, OmpR family, sensor kinase
MGRLFWKFFVSYWAALLVTVLGVTTALWLYQMAEQGRDLSLETGPRTSFVVGSAGATLRYGGPAALRALLEETSRRGDALVLAVDDAGQDLLGRPVSPDALDRARALAAPGRASEAVQRIRLGDGSSYLLYLPVAATPWPQRLLFRGGPPSPMVPLAAGLLASLIFGALLAWYVARPIRHLRAAFTSLSAGKLETRVGPLIGGRRDEVADLARDFDGMAQQLQKLMTAQRTLLHEVSHELRSPLARLQAAIGLARQSPEGLEATFERIEREAERLDELVGQLLTLSRLDASVDRGASEQLESCDLVDLVASIAADADFEAQATGRSVEFRATGEAVAVVRAELVCRAVENVVRNAVKYTSTGTVVEVMAGPSEAGRSFVVRVADRGPGVVEDELEAIFRPFHRSVEGPLGPGFGLGLAIARRAVITHGGTVLARNRDGGGLVVEIELPLVGQQPETRP